MLNLFRPLSRLPLQKATVQTLRSIRHSTIRAIYEERCRKAKVILLSDGHQDEEAQVEKVTVRLTQNGTMLSADFC